MIPSKSSCEPVERIGRAARLVDRAVALGASREIRGPRIEALRAELREESADRARGARHG